ADFDNPIKLGVYDLVGNNFIDTLIIPLSSRQQVSYINQPSIPLCFEFGTYTATLDVYEDFYISTHRCFRTVDILNVDSELGVTIYTEIKLDYNLSYIGQPVFNVPIVNGIGATKTIDISSPGTLMDSTIYEFSTPIQGGNRIDPLP